MDIQMISERSISIYITSEDLEKRRLTADSFSIGDAEDIISGVLGSSVGRAKLELFPGKGGLLIFVRRTVSDPELYTFSSVEPIIAAAHSLPCEPSALYFYGGEYILAVWHLDNTPLGFEEFGEKLPAPPEFTEHLCEHGRLLIPSDAISELRRIFDP